MDQARANRLAMEADERRRQDFRPQPPAPQDPSPFAPPEGTVAWHLAQAEASRAHLDGVRDIRTGPRVEVDRIWSGLANACREKFGRVPSVETWDQPDDEAAMALQAARSAETALLQACASSTASDALVAELRAQFYAAVRRWQGVACAGWPSRAEHERQQARHRETW